MIHTRGSTRSAAVVVAVGLMLCASACSSSGSNKSSGQTITIVTHDSFAVSDDVLKAFEDQSGITVKQVKSGDAGALVNQAILTKDHPQGDVLYGIDNTLLTKGLDAGLFEPYTSSAFNAVDPTFDLDPSHRVTPIDESDVCLNYDKGAFGGADQPAAPKTLEDLTSAPFADKVVVENPATSSPGLAFLVATVKHFGEDHYLDYWRQLKDNGLKVVDGWDQAYNNEFSVGSGGTGTRTVVLSYGTSPPADVVFANPPKDDTSRRRGAGQLLPAGRVRRGPPGHLPRGRGAQVHRLHALQAVPGGHAAADVRVSGAHRRGGAGCLHEVRGQTRGPDRAGPDDHRPEP